MLWWLWNEVVVVAGRSRAAPNRMARSQPEINIERDRCRYARPPDAVVSSSSGNLITSLSLPRASASTSQRHRDLIRVTSDGRLCCTRISPARPCSASSFARSHCNDSDNTASTTATLFSSRFSTPCRKWNLCITCRVVSHSACPAEIDMCQGRRTTRTPSFAAQSLTSTVSTPDRTRRLRAHINIPLHVILLDRCRPDQSQRIQRLHSKYVPAAGGARRAINAFESQCIFRRDKLQ